MRVGSAGGPGCGRGGGRGGRAPARALALGRRAGGGQESKRGGEAERGERDALNSRTGTGGPAGGPNLVLPLGPTLGGADRLITGASAIRTAATRNITAGDQGMPVTVIAAGALPMLLAVILTVPATVLALSGRLSGRSVTGAAGALGFAGAEVVGAEPMGAKTLRTEPRGAEAPALARALEGALLEGSPPEGTLLEGALEGRPGVVVTTAFVAPTPSPLHQLPYEPYEFGRLEGLGEKRVDAHVETALDLVLGAGADDGEGKVPRPRIRTKAGGGPQSVEPGHDHVERHDIGPHVMHHVQTLGTIGRGHDLDALQLEIDPDQLPDDLVVVHNKHPTRRA